MASDLTADMTLRLNVVGDGGGMCIVSHAAGTAADYFDMDTVLGHDVSVIYAIGMEDKSGTEAASPMIWTGTSTTPDRITIGGSGSAVVYDILVCYQARKSTGGGA